ncbi:MAG: hypothetical protein U0324_09055 [Polyangiales bacterium]
MNDPPRTPDDPAAPRTLARLVKGARADGPTEAELAALTAALRARTAAGGPSGASPPRARTRWLARALPAAAVVGAAAALLARAERPATTPRAPAAVTAPAPARPAPPPPAAAPAPAPSPAPAPAAVAAPPPTHVAVPEAPSAAPCDPAAHVRAVDSARRSLREGSPAESLALVARDRRACLRGALAEERDRVEIESLLALNRRPEAERRLALFAREHPGSLHLLQLRARMDNGAAPAIPSRP